MSAAGACHGTDLGFLVGIVLNDVTVDVLVLAADELVVTRLQFLGVRCVVTHELTLNTIINVDKLSNFCYSMQHVLYPQNRLYLCAKSSFNMKAITSHI